MRRLLLPKVFQEFEQEFCKELSFVDITTCEIEIDFTYSAAASAASTTTAGCCQYCFFHHRHCNEGDPLQACAVEAFVNALQDPHNTGTIGCQIQMYRVDGGIEFNATDEELVIISAKPLR
jgi:hypothetical protein